MRVIAELETTAERTYVDPFAIGMIHAALGDRDNAFVWFEKARAMRAENLLFYRYAPIMDPVRDDPRFASLYRPLEEDRPAATAATPPAAGAR